MLYLGKFLPPKNSLRYEDAENYPRFKHARIIIFGFDKGAGEPLRSSCLGRPLQLLKAQAEYVFFELLKIEVLWQLHFLHCMDKPLQH